MSNASKVLGQRRLFLFGALLLTLAGLVSWFTLPREEYARMPDRFGLISVAFPGADPEVMERRVLEPIEDELAEVEEVLHVDATVRSGTTIVAVELRTTVAESDWDDAWEKVEDALGRASLDLPDGTSAPRLEHEIRAPQSILLALTGPDDRSINDLVDAAQALRRRLLGVAGVSEVIISGDPGQQIAVTYSQADSARVGLSPTELAAQLRAANMLVPGGSIEIGGLIAAVRPQTEIRESSTMETFPIRLPSGTVVPLGEIASVQRTAQTPPSERARFNGRRAVTIGVIPRTHTNVVDLGREVRGLLSEVAQEFSPLVIDEIVYDPARIEAKIGDLGWSLLIGMAIVAGVLVIFMGFRMGVVAAVIVPLVTFSALQIYAAAGGELNQSSIAGLIVALGMLVDNAIVVTELIQRRIDKGDDPARASRMALSELWLPLLTATGTTLAAFLPMLIFDAHAREFIRGLPVMIMLSLAASYVYAVFVTPNLAAMALRRSRKRTDPIGRLTPFIERVVTRHPRAILVFAVLAVAGSLSLAPKIKQLFFPYTDHGTFVVQLELTEGAHISQTDEAVARLEAALGDHPEVSSVASFVGRGTPLFRYNVIRRPNSPHLAELMVQTSGNEAADRTQAWVREYAAQHMPEMHVVARQLREGIPFASPLEVRVLGDDLASLDKASQMVLGVMRSFAGAHAVRRDGSTGIPSLHYAVDEAEARRLGLSGAQLAQAWQGRNTGIVAGEIWIEGERNPVVVQAPEADGMTPTQLEGTLIAGMSAPASRIATGSVAWLPAQIQHRDRRRMVVVRGEIETWSSFAWANSFIEPRIAELDLPPGVALEIGGEWEASAQTEGPLNRAMPLGMLILVAILVAEFRSFRRSAIVLATAPLAAIGVVVGLLSTGLEFGFMSILGSMALVGIVVNNAIVLVDLIDRRRAEGATVDEALRTAIGQRTRPIFLTTLTTVGGLLPLALGGTRMWPPMAWVMIFGLLVSAGLTVAVIPALYRVLVGRSRPPAS